MPQIEMAVSELTQRGEQAIAEGKFAEAMELLMRAAETGDYFAMYDIACMYYFGDGVKKDDEAAFSWYKNAAEHGDPEAANRVAIMLSGGIGCEKNAVAAFDWYRRSAEAGSLSGMANYGVQLLKGNCRSQDVPAGLMWLDRASEGGNGIASELLGDYCVNGSYGPADPVKAAAYYERGVEQKYAPPVRKLAEMYEAGCGLPKDTKKAAELEKLAAELDNFTD